MLVLRITELFIQSEASVVIQQRRHQGTLLGRINHSEFIISQRFTLHKVFSFSP